MSRFVDYYILVSHIKTARRCDSQTATATITITYLQWSGTLPLFTQLHPAGTWRVGGCRAGATGPHRWRRLNPVDFKMRPASAR